MKDDDALLPVSTPTSSSVVSFSGLFGRRRYKCWALAAILLLAFCSMLTATVSLRRSAGDFSRLNDSPAVEFLDVLDLEEREKLVKQMWDVYTGSHRTGLVGFWQDAFVAAYEDLSSDAPLVRDIAISEIAMMSVRYLPSLNSPFSLGMQDLNLQQKVTAL
ncbi:hypothetical protein ABFS83_08G075100 [Erythranthe nasuta]